MSSTKFLLLGTPRLEQNGLPVDIGLRKAEALVIYLAMTGQMFTRDKLASMFWPNNDQTDARANLRRSLHRIHKSLGDGLLVTDADTVKLSPSAEIWIDVHTFIELTRDGLNLDTASTALESRPVKQLLQALELYSGDFMAGFTLPDCPAFDEWQFFERESLRHTQSQVLVQLMGVFETHGFYAKAINFARHRLALDPLHEPAHYALMRLYAQDKQRAAALRQFQECARILKTELDMLPQPATVALFESIRSGQYLSAAPEHTFYPPVRYVKNGDVHIAYQVVGEGPITVVLVGGFVSHLEHAWDDPALAQFFTRLASFCRLILFDKRGIGLSDRIGYAPTLENTVDDILAILKTLASDQVILLGVSEGGPNSALFAATYPERVAGLILYGTIAKFTHSPDHPWALTREQWDKWLDFLEHNWGEALSIERFAPSRAGDSQFKLWWAETLRFASSPGAIRAVLDVAANIDIRALLATIRVPTLVLHRTGDQVMRVEGARDMAGRMPNARLVELPGIDHWWWVGETKVLMDEIQAFVEKLASTNFSSNRVTVTLLCLMRPNLDTSPTAQLDDRYFTFLARSEATFERFGGRFIRQESDTALAAFDNPSEALRCAQFLEQQASTLGTKVQIGLHSGECTLNGGILEGPAIAIVRAVAARAAFTPVLISSTVKQLVTGLGFPLKQSSEIVSNQQDQWELYELSTGA